MTQLHKRQPSYLLNQLSIICVAFNILHQMLSVQFFNLYFKGKEVQLYRHRHAYYSSIKYVKYRKIVFSTHIIDF